MTTLLDARAPPALQRLHALFGSLEFSLSSLALYQRSTDWETVKRAVESSSQTTLSKEHVQQMLWLCPNAYSLTWSRRPASRKRARAAGASDHDDRDPEEPLLLLRRQRLTPATDVATATSGDSAVPTTESISERIEFFTKRLNAFVDEHVAVITSDCPSASDDDVAAALAALEIDLAVLPEQEATSIHEKNHERLKELAKKSAQAVSSSELEQALAAPVPEDLQTLPKWLVDKVRRQEQQSKRASQRTDAAQKQRLYTTLPQLSDQIQSLLLVQRKHVFLLADMNRQLLTKAPMREQIEEQIHLLESMVPFWLTVFFADGKQYVKLSKRHKYNDVKAALRKALATMA